MTGSLVARSSGATLAATSRVIAGNRDGDRRDAGWVGAALDALTADAFLASLGCTTTIGLGSRLVTKTTGVSVIVDTPIRIGRSRRVVMRSIVDVVVTDSGDTVFDSDDVVFDSGANVPDSGITMIDFRATDSDFGVTNSDFCATVPESGAVAFDPGATVSMML